MTSIAYQDSAYTGSVRQPRIDSAMRQLQVGLATVAVLTTAGFNDVVPPSNIIGFGSQTGWRAVEVVFPAGGIIELPHVRANKNVVTDRSLSAQLVRRLREQSGLTWDQLGRLFGVSRRAVHLWASGGRLNATNFELLGHLLTVIEQLPGTSPEEKRASLLQPTGVGGSLYDQIRARHASSPSDINRTAFLPYQFLGGEDLS